MLCPGSGVNARRNETRIALPPLARTDQRRTAEVRCTVSSHDVAQQVLMPRRLMSGRLLCSVRARNAIHYQFNEARRGSLPRAPRRLLFNSNSAGNSTGDRAESYTRNASRANLLSPNDIRPIYATASRQSGRIKN